MDPDRMYYAGLPGSNEGEKVGYIVDWTGRAISGKRGSIQMRV